MKTYIYPSNLKLKATIWFWNIRDLVILVFGAVLSVLALLYLHTTIVLAITVSYGIATARFEDNSIMGRIIVAARYLFIVPQTYYRKFDPPKQGDHDNEKET